MLGVALVPFHSPSKMTGLADQGPNERNHDLSPTSDERHRQFSYRLQLGRSFFCEL